MHDQKYLGRGMVGAYSLSDQNARNGGRQDLEMGTTKKMKKGNQKTELRKGGRMPKLKRGTLLTERRTDSLGSEHVFQCPKKNAYLVCVRDVLEADQEVLLCYLGARTLKEVVVSWRQVHKPWPGFLSPTVD